MGNGSKIFVLHKLLPITSSITAKSHFRQKWTWTVLVLSPRYIVHKQKIEIVKK